MKNSKSALYWGIFLAPIILVLGGYSLDAYVRGILRSEVKEQISIFKEEMRDEVNTEVKRGIKDGLSDKETKKVLTDTMRKAISKELDENGKKHFGKIFGGGCEDDK